MSTKPPEPARPDPSAMFASLIPLLERLGGLDGMMKKLDTAERDGELIKIKVAILLETVLPPNWKDDPRILAFEKKFNVRLKRP